ncbi:MULTISPECIES: hypothetical protein [unclassified Acidiphilium]|uniref:hypothetical protein n=1 Tax=unclassified Acidiphilium TaxID=2617493 RepID=UPI000BCC8C69|nr:MULTISPECIES: hypothetical protein [unclassified Acidiphilium]OYV54220.1 MAG: hypothetical protein B7Z76_15330 [Acidiphilium sp. 20-67-58]HQT62636.1 hypothetical protein [Acidiphilium sp.]
MTRAAKPGSNATLREALLYVAAHPRHWPGFTALLVRHVAGKARFYVMCWRAGYRVSTVRRLAREAGR